MADQLNVDAFLEQARSYEKAASSPVGWYIRFVALCVWHWNLGLQCSHLEAKLFLLSRNAQTRQLSHPLPVLRASEIDEWSRSPAYRSLLKRGIQIGSLQQKI